MHSIDSLILIRHGESAYNEHQSAVKNSKLYKDFLRGLSGDIKVATKEIATELAKINIDFKNNEDVPLSYVGQLQASTTSSKLKHLVELPDVIYISPFRRTLDTLASMGESWPELKDVPIIRDDRLKEQNHGQCRQYGDWKLYSFFNSEQRVIREKQGLYYYKYPDGESIADVQVRTKSLLDDIGKKEKGKKVMMVGHYISFLTIRASLENLSPEALMDFNDKNKLVNCGVTLYRNNIRQTLDNSKLY